MTTHGTNASLFLIKKPQHAFSQSKSAVLLLMGAIVLSHSLSAEEILIRNCRIIDTSNGAISQSHILINDEQIQAITADMPSSTHLKQYDAEGRYVMAGLIDAHVHLATAIQGNMPKKKMETTEHLSIMLQAGITTVRDMAGNGDLLTILQAEALPTSARAPQIFYAACFAGPEYYKMVNESAGQGDEGGTQPYAQTITPSTLLPDAVRAAKACGATGIKIYNDIPGSLMAKITEEGHKQGMQVWSHLAVLPATPLDAVTAKVNTVSHAFDMVHQVHPDPWDKTKSYTMEQVMPVFRVMKENDVILDATNYIADKNGFSTSFLVTKTAHQMGIRVAVGTDWIYRKNLIPLYDEVALLESHCGFSRQEALHALTVINAAAIGLQDRGVVAVGKRADLVILDKNPLDNLNNLKAPWAVVKGGYVHRFGNQ